MTVAQIGEVVQYFADGARRAREAGLDGVELHGANGYLITQFLSSAINDRKDDYGGALENRARFVLDVVRAIRAGGRRRLPPADEDQRHRSRRRAGVVQERAGGQHPRRVRQGVPVAGRSRCRCDPRLDRQLLPASDEIPPGVDLPVDDLAKSYDTMISSGERTFLNYLLFRGHSGEIARRQWNRRRRRSRRRSRARICRTPAQSSRP